MLDKMLYITHKLITSGSLSAVQLNQMEDYNVESFYSLLQPAVRNYFVETIGLTENEVDTILQKLS